MCHYESGNRSNLEVGVKFYGNFITLLFAGAILCAAEERSQPMLLAIWGSLHSPFTLHHWHNDQEMVKCCGEENSLGPVWVPIVLLIDVNMAARRRFRTQPIKQLIKL